MFLFDTSRSRIVSRSRQICQENIRGAVFWPWPTKHFLASFNFIMKAWTATNSQIGTKPIWGPHPLLPLSARPVPICFWPFPFNRIRVCMKTNVFNPPLLHSLGWGWEGVAAYRWSQCLCVCPPPPYPAPHLPFLPHPPITDPTLHSIRCTLPWCCFFYKEGACFHIHVGWPCGSLTMRIRRCTVHLLALREWFFLGVLGLGLRKIPSDSRCYGLCDVEAEAMRQVQPLAWLKRW